MAPHDATVGAMASSPMLWSPIAGSNTVSQRREQEFAAHFPFRNAKPLVSCSLYRQSTSLEDLYFNGDILLRILCQKGNVRMDLSAMFLPLENQS